MKVKKSRIKIILLTPLMLFAMFYALGVFFALSDDRSVAPLSGPSLAPKTIAIFGASGTAGDGILKSALASPDINKIHVITRRVTDRMTDGISTGKIELTRHIDYLDYSAIIDQLANVDAVYWAIGISSLGVDEETYSMIHVDFPMQFVTEWTGASKNSDISFHYISSSDISDESTAIWAREKLRAEKSLFALAEGSKMNVIAYRPDYIGATRAEAHLGQDILYWFFAPLGAAVKATQIGQAMIEVTAREQEFKNGDKLSTGKIIRYSDAYEGRM